MSGQGSSDGVAPVKVTIGIPAYNPRYFEQALRSAIDQSYADIEILVSDDCPDDGIREIVERYHAESERPIRYVRNSPALGGLLNLDQCLREARGRYVKFLNDDDLLEPDCVARMVAVFEAESDVRLVTSRRILIDADGAVLPDIPATRCPFSEDVVVPGADLIALLHRSPINFIGEPSTVMVRRADLLEVRPHAACLNGHEVRAINDLAMYVNLFRHGDMAYLVQPLSRFRQHGEQRQRQADISDLAEKGKAVLRREIGRLAATVAVEEGCVRVRPLRGGGAETAVRVFELRARRIAVVVHLYYPEMWPEIAERLWQLPCRFDLLVTTIPLREAQVRELVLADVPHARIEIVPNRGRDVGPLIALLDKVRLEDYDYVLKLHTKKSPHLDGDAGEAWRKLLLCSLLPAVRIEQLLQALDQHPDIGMLGSAHSRTEVHAASRDAGLRVWLDRLAERLGFVFEKEEYSFFAGTMFWARGSVFAELRRLGLKLDDFELEAGQVEGTLAHAMERLFPLLAKKAGLRCGVLPDSLLVGPADAELVAAAAKRVREISAFTLEHWLATRTPDVQGKALLDAALDGAHADALRLAVLILEDGQGPAKVAATLASLEEASDARLCCAVRVVSTAGGSQCDPSWLAVPAGGVAVAANAWLREGGFDWLLMVDAGSLFTVAGLRTLQVEMRGAPGCRGVFADELWLGPDGLIVEGAFRPDFNLDFLLSHPGAMARHWLLSRATLLDLGGVDESCGAAFELEMILRFVEQGGFAGLGHVSEPLLQVSMPSREHDEQVRQVLLRHLQRRGYAAATVEAALAGTWRLVYGHAERPLVSIIIPTRDNLPLLRRCVESLMERTSYGNYEVLIVDNDSRDADAMAWLEGLERMGLEQVRVLRYPQSFNYSAMNNLAARHARGEYLLLLNNDTAVIQPEWLERMLNHAQRPEVGVVGCKLLYPNGKVQHAGVLLGLRGPADHPYVGVAPEDAGHMLRLQVDQNYSAVTAACLLIRKSVYEQVGGLDEAAFAVSYNDVDLCLKVVEAGYLVVWTPHAQVMHVGSVSQKGIDTKAQAAKRERFRGEQERMYSKWMPLLANDPAYNRNLSLAGRGFEVDTRTTLLGAPAARFSKAPVVLAANADFAGCGHYRVIQPFEAMRAAGIARGVRGSILPLPSELARLRPDTVVLQKPLKDEYHEAIRRLRPHTDALLVYEIDDNLLNVPRKSVHRVNVYPDMARRLRTGISLCDRLVVSTPALAEVLAGFHADIRVVENRLPLPWWGGVEKRRHDGARPRVGWAGGVGHSGDLALVVDVIRELASEVDWVFFGMCPASIQPFVQEFHPGVQTKLYPQSLPALALDLAIAPLEDNPFNACKSNLRLLEHGACGFPVVCSDVRPYREHALPVTRVRNRFRDWVDAIREHVADRDEAAQRGLALQAAVRRDWMLEGEGLQVWRSAWLDR